MPKINREVEQGKPEWVAAKLGKPSASNASRLITSKGKPSESMKEYAEDLAKELFTRKPTNNWRGNASTDYGLEMEEESRVAYEFLTDYDVEQVGFITDDLERYLCSPDGLIGEDGGLELKNKPKLHLKTLLYYNKYKKIPANYIAQLQMSLFISKRAWWDLYYYNDLLPRLRVRIEPDPVMFRALEMQLAAVIAERDSVLKILREL